MQTWQPSANVTRLRQRAAITQSIRDFFQARQVLEVETPALTQHTVTDPFLDAMTTEHALPGSSSTKSFYLQTSPEYAMKRMLAAGFPDIYQISKCFRQDEIGRLHNPEFSMLEWYRLNFTMQNLIDEVAELLKHVLKVSGVEQNTYGEVFQAQLGLDPHDASIEKILNVCGEYGLADYACQLQKVNDKSVLKDALLQVLFSQCIEPKIGQDLPICITHFPKSQASLARLSPDEQTALRFEVYFKNVELANGFEELTDAKSQYARFTQDNIHRASINKPKRDIDPYFMEALKQPLPACSGVALGLDRLVMLALGCKHISEVLSFDITRA